MPGTSCGPFRSGLANAHGSGYMPPAALAGIMLDSVGSSRPRSARRTPPQRLASACPATTMPAPALLEASADLGHRRRAPTPAPSCAAGRLRGAAQLVPGPHGSVLHHSVIGRPTPAPGRRHSGLLSATHKFMEASNRYAVSREEAHSLPCYSYVKVAPLAHAIPCALGTGIVRAAQLVTVVFIAQRAKQYGRRREPSVRYDRNGGIALPLIPGQARNRRRNQEE